MKRFYILLTMLFFSATFVAQNTITGTVTEKGTDQALIGASVFLKGTSKGTITNFDGFFKLENVANGTFTLEVSYTGFSDMTMEVTVNGDTDIGTVSLEAGVGLQEILVVSSAAIDRRTPVAVSTIKGDVIEAKIGNQEYPEILKKTPSVYVTKQGGGFGDARINVRGFNQNYFAVMINGIPVNDMENGWVYWSNWAGLSDVTNRIQYQRGLGATKLAVPTVGGSINIITNPAGFSKGGNASVSYGNDNFLKASASYSTGLSDKGFAATFQVSHTRGDGYVDGTAFQAYSYFAAISKSFGDKHMLTATILGAPQWHHQRLGASRFDNISLRTFHDPDDTGLPETDLGIKWNHTWGVLDGEEFNWRKNFYHKPKAFLNHYWTLNDNVEIKTAAYYSQGRGGGTGPRGRLRTPGSVFDSFSGLGQGIHNSSGQVRFDDIVSYNRGGNVASWGSKETSSEFGGIYVVSEDGRIYTDASGNVVSDDHSDYDSRSNAGSGFIRRASMNSHNWFGVLSTLTAKLTDNLTLTTGIDLRDYTGIHYRRVENLLGADGYSSKSNINNQSNLITEPSPADFGNFNDNSYKEGNNVLNYWNDGRVRWMGAFGQLEYSADKLSVFGSISLANQAFKRIDYFNYLNSDPAIESDWESFGGGQFKLGANYNLTDNHNVYANTGFYSKQPLFDNVFINFRNDVNPDLDNENVTSFELGYGYRSSNLTIDAGLYYTNWTNRQFDVGVDLPEEEEGLALFRDVGQTHTGLELELDYNPSSRLGFEGMASIGNWKYSSNFSASITNVDNGQSVGELTIYGDGLKIGDAAQTVFSVGTYFDIIDGLRANADITYYDNLYAQYDINDSQYQSPGGEVAKLPGYSLVDAGLSYNFEVGGNKSNIRLNINNLLNTRYIAESFTNIQDDPSTPRNEIYDNRGFWGFGTTWNMRYKVWF